MQLARPFGRIATFIVEFSPAAFNAPCRRVQRRARESRPRRAFCPIISCMLPCQIHLDNSLRLSKLQGVLRLRLSQDLALHLQSPAGGNRPERSQLMDLAIWLGALAILGLAVLGIMFAFVAGCDKV